MPLRGFEAENFQIDESGGPCFRASVTGGRYRLDRRTMVKADLVLSGRVNGNTLENAVCHCRVHGGRRGRYSSREICQLLRTRAAQQIAVVKTRLEECGAANEEEEEIEN